MRLVLLLAAVLFAAPASAQFADYRPLHIGNEWTYASHRISQSGTTSCGQPPLRDYIRLQVDADTTVGGAEARLVTCTQYAVDGAVIGTGRLAVPVAFGTLSTVLSGSTLCGQVIGVTAPVAATDLPNTVDLGGTAYAMNSVARRISMGVGPGGQGGGSEHLYGDLIGLYEASSWSTGHWQYPSCSASRHRLVHATVAGVTYGSNPVSEESIPEGSVDLAVSAYPNPARGALAVSLSLTEAASVRVEAFDALGRRVAEVERALPAGTAEVRLDASAWAPGVYVVRAVTERGASRAIRVIQSE